MSWEENSSFSSRERGRGHDFGERPRPVLECCVPAFRSKVQILKENEREREGGEVLDDFIPIVFTPCFDLLRQLSYWKPSPARFRGLLLLPFQHEK